MYVPQLLIHSSADGHLGCFHVLAIINSSVMNIGLHVSLSDLVSSREKQQITHKGITTRITADLSIETLQARREWQDILKVMKENNLHPRLLYPARISFRYEGEFKSFTDKQKLREFSTTKPALRQMLKYILSTGNTERLYKREPKTTN